MSTRFRPLLALAASLALAGCQSSSSDHPSAIQGATTLKPPAGTDAYVSAVHAMRAGDEDKAIADLEAALTINPGLRMARMTLGELYMKRKAYDKAVPNLQVATELDPYTLKNFYNLGLSLQVINRLEESARAYLRAIDLDKDDFKTNMNLGLVYFALGKMDPAVHFIERATRIEPNNVRGWSNLGVAYDAAGNLILAEASYRKSLELDAANESTLINLTSNLIAQKKTEDAIAIAERLVAVSATPLSRKRLGDALTTAGRWDDAAKAYDAATAIDPTYTPAINAKAEMFATRYENELRLDDSLRQKAIDTWQASLKIDANQPLITANVERLQTAKQFK